MEMDEAELREQETDVLLDSHVQPDQSQVGAANQVSQGILVKKRIYPSERTII